MATHLLKAEGEQEIFCLCHNICPFIFTFIAYSPPYISVYGMTILFLAYKNFKSKYTVYIYILWHLENTVLFMAYRCRATHIYISVYDII